MATPAIECQTLGFLGNTFQRNTFQRELTVCGQLSVDTISSNAINGLTEFLATGVPSGFVISANGAISAPGVELSYIRVGNGIDINVDFTYVSSATADANVQILISPTAAYAGDLIVPSGVSPGIQPAWINVIPPDANNALFTVWPVGAVGSPSATYTVIQWTTTDVVTATHTVPVAANFQYQTAQYYY